MKRKEKKKRERYIEYNLTNELKIGSKPEYPLFFRHNLHSEWSNEMARNRHNAIRPNPIIHRAILLVKRFHAAYLALIVGSRSLANTCAHSVKIHGCMDPAFGNFDVVQRESADIFCASFFCY